MAGPVWRGAGQFSALKAADSHVSLHYSLSGPINVLTHYCTIYSFYYSKQTASPRFYDGFRFGIELCARTQLREMSAGFITLIAGVNGYTTPSVVGLGLNESMGKVDV